MEGRKTALSTYLSGLHSRDGSESVLINPRVDTFFLDGIPDSSFGEYEMSKYVRRIALVFDYREMLGDNPSTSQVFREIKFLCNKLSALEEVQIALWNERGMSRFADCATAREEAELWHGFAVECVRWRKQRVARLREVVEQMGGCAGLSSRQTSITVRAVTWGTPELELEPLTELAL